MRRLRVLTSFIGIVTLLGFGTIFTADASNPNPNDFEFESYHADYVLDIDEDGRSTLRTTETVVAMFPDYDQNRGIQRAIPHSYNGHDTDLTVVSVTDEDGNRRPFDTWVEGEFEIVQAAVPEGEYEHGRTVYTITYLQNDVTHSFADTGADEFYWDLNGTGWAQPFGTVSATLTIGPELSEAFTGETACYRGPEYASDTCPVSHSSTDDSTVFEVSETLLDAHENVTLAVGFTPGTFAERPTPWYVNNLALIWSGLASVALGLITIIASTMRNARGARTGDPIIAQYDPPKNVSLAVSATVVKREKSTPTATLLDLAVRGNLRLLRDPDQDLFGAQLLHTDGLEREERTFANKLFNGRISTEIDETTGKAKRGSRGSFLWFTSRDHSLGDAAASLKSRAAVLSREAGYRVNAPFWPVGLLLILLTAGVALIAFYFFGSGDFVAGTIFATFGGIIGLLVCIIATAIYYAQKPVTRLGASLRDHLEGLRLYISLAEADRLRMLQSVSGAEVTPEHVVKVYERLLPYAVMWGMEREWQAALAKYYVETPPEWAAGDASDWVTNAAVLQSLNRTVLTSRPTPLASSSGGSSSWSGSSGSSFSSGGSSGGGFSGGGGGGGGGRGI